jgi:hypothetical protein
MNSALRIACHKSTSTRGVQRMFAILISPSRCLAQTHELRLVVWNAFFVRSTGSTRGITSVLDDEGVHVIRHASWAS